MKSLLIVLMAILLFCATAGVGYLAWRDRIAPALNPVSSSAPASSSAASSSRPARNELQKELQTSITDPETLEKLLYEISKNADTVAWLTVPGTDIDNSVLQSHNNQQYLRRDERGRDSVYGCYFADYECSVGDRENLLPNTIIYGHSDLKDNPDGPKFSQLFRYTDEEFARQNSVISLSTPEETMEWQVFAVFYTTTAFDYIRVDNSEQVQKSIIDNALSLSVHDMGLKPTGSDKILTLSTCSVRDGNDGTHRFVVMACLKENE